MTFKLFEKLFLLFFSMMLLLLSLVIVAVHFNFQKGLTAYLQKIELQKLEPFALELGEFYKIEKSWDTLLDEEAWSTWVAHSSLAKNPNTLQPIQIPLPTDATWIDVRRISIIDHDNNTIIGTTKPSHPFDFSTEYKLTISSKIPQEDKTNTHGFLIVKPNPIITDLLLVNFMESQLQGYLWIMAFALLLSLFLAFLMARQILSPLQNITVGMRMLATGNFSLQIPISKKSHDELATLAKDFNILSRALAQSEKARQQWLADISHELRTPLAVLRGEIEALVDGVRATTPERLQSLEQEVLSLTRLVDDLYQLSLSDLGALDYQFNPVELVSHFKILMVSFQNRFASRQMQLIFQTDLNNATVNGDAMRLVQLFSNLLENSYRYTHDNGLCRVTLLEEADYFIIYIDDSAPSVDEEELPLLFERFHRVDKSRHRQTGGAGLGLAICHNIVKAHNGYIYAQTSELGGVRIVVELPKF
ncbi:MAG: Histidine kinase [Pseudomonadota bacterium]|nr:Histidine kinase [Pseudomonadota bacterium]